VKSVHPEITAICIEADKVLWTAFVQSQQSGITGTGKLLFPKYRNDALRVSEQEARFAFVEGLYSSQLLYTVEAPTSKKYQFKGKSPLSAQTDLAIHDVMGTRICNVEFKAKGVSPSAKNHFPIYKDLQKLLREPLWGLWFHLLEAVNSSSLNDFLGVMESEMNHVYQNFSDIESPGVTIHICVLKHGFSIQRDFLPGNNLKNLHNQFRIDLKVSRSKLERVDNANGWHLHTWQSTS